MRSSCTSSPRCYRYNQCHTNHICSAMSWGIGVCLPPTTKIRPAPSAPGVHVPLVHQLGMSLHPMQEFLPEVAPLQAEPAAPVRRQLAELLEAAVGARPSLASLAAILACLGALLHDPASSVVKRAVLASAVALR